MRILIVLLMSHVVLLLLAATNFSLVSWLWGDLSLSWSYFDYCYRTGWGHTYVSEYPLGQVLCYTVAYGLGVAAFAIAWLKHQLYLSAAATVLCLLGVLSFSIEATHWLWRHHVSWIASFPAALVVLWVCVGVQVCHLHRRRTESDLHCAESDHG